MYVGHTVGHNRTITMQVARKLIMNVLRLFPKLLLYYWSVLVAVLAYYFAKYFNKKSSRKGLVELEDITQISARVTRILGQNPGPFTLQGTNTYLVGLGPKRILIDSGEPNRPKYIENLGKALGTSEIDCIILTHYHRDHSGGVDAVLRTFTKGVPVYKIKRTDGKEEPFDEGRIKFVEDGTIIKTDGATVKVIATPGHTCDHLSLFLEEEKVMFSGDSVLGDCSSTFDDLASYLKSLEKFLSYPMSMICTGHGPVVRNPRETILEYMDHRQKREDQIVNYLRTVDSANAMEIISSIYDRSLPASIRLGAFVNIKQHLKKLVADRTIVKKFFVDYSIRP